MTPVCGHEDLTDHSQLGIGSRCGAGTILAWSGRETVISLDVSRGTSRECADHSSIGGSGWPIRTRDSIDRRSAVGETPRMFHVKHSCRRGGSVRRFPNVGQPHSPQHSPTADDQRGGIVGADSCAARTPTLR